MCLSRRFHFVNNPETSLFNVSRRWQEILENICWNLKVLLEDCHICTFPIKKREIFVCSYCVLIQYNDIQNKNDVFNFTLHNMTYR